MQLLTTQEMRDLEQAADAQGLSYSEMMEQAGLAVAEAARDLCPQGISRALVLVGPGNNGGDGLVAARYLDEWGIEVAVYIWRRRVDPDPNLELLCGTSVSLMRAADDPELANLAQLVERADVLIDALLGTGAAGPLRGGLPELLGCVHERVESRRAARPRNRPLFPSKRSGECPRPAIVAVDLPSGLDADTGAIDERALRADLTVTFAHPKRGLMASPGADYTGRLIVADIGIALEPRQEQPLAVITADDVAGLLPVRQSQGHKGTFGSAMVLGGSSNYVGAPCLAGKAAYRAGAGLVTLATPAAIHGAAALLLPEATHLILPHSLGALVEAALPIVGPELSRYAALLVGPGLGQAPETGTMLAHLLAGEHGEGQRTIGFVRQARASTQVALSPLVIDADGLNLLAQLPDWPTKLPPDTILTPHPGEMARLCGCTAAEVNAARLETARQAAIAWQCVVVLKGAFTVVAAPDGQLWVNPCANAALATAGSGDVLAGAIVGLRAQGLDALSAALCGVYLHGLAGEIWAERQGHSGLLAGELADLLPEACRRVRGD